MVKKGSNLRLLGIWLTVLMFYFTKCSMYKLAVSTNICPSCWCLVCLFLVAGFGLSFPCLVGWVLVGFFWFVFIFCQVTDMLRVEF